MTLRNLLFFSALTVALGTGSQAADRYAAPNGSASNAGSISSPWDLQTAFSNASPGDTVWLRGGTYPGRYNCYASGTSSAPIIYRQYPGEHAKIATGQTQLGSITLQCHDVWLWGFEIYSTDPIRVSSQTGSFPTDIARGPTIEGAPDGTRCKLINMVLHDDFNPFFGAQASGLEIYGTLSYYSGWDAPDRGHGHSLYSQNAPSSATKVISDNILFDSFAEGLHIYASGDNMDNYDIEGNVILNAGYPSETTGYTTNVIVGGSGVAPKNIMISNNYSYHEPLGPARKSDSRGLWLGSSGAGCSNATVTNNYFVDLPSGIAMTLESGCKPTMTGNTFLGKLSGFSQSQYAGNTYYTQTPVGGNNIFVRPNKYESGRANIIVYNWALASSVAVNLSSVLQNGDKYVIQDAQNFFGSPVAQGTYSGGTVNIPMNSASIAQMVGNSPVIPEHTSPEFGVFVVMKSSGSGTTPPPTNPPPTNPPPTNPPPTQPVANGTYAIKNVTTHLAVDDPGFSNVSGQQIIQWGYNGGSNQKWRFVANSSGYYTIQNSSSGLYLTDPKGATTSGTPLEQIGALNNDSQLWKLTASGGGYLIQNKAGGLVVDAGSSTKQGSGLVLSRASGASSQNWQLQ